MLETLMADISDMMIEVKSALIDLISTDIFIASTLGFIFGMAFFGMLVFYHLINSKR